MAQTNFTPILTYKSDTAAAVPSAGNLTNSANGAELAVNTADKRLFTKDSGGSVVELGTNPSSVTLPNGTANGVVYANGSKVLTTGSALTFDGTNIALKVSNGTQGFVLGVGNEAMIASDASTYYFGAGWGGAPAVNFQFGSPGTTYQRWLAGGSEQMRLTSTGLGIGTSSPAYKLDVRGSAGSIVSWSDGTTPGVLYSGSDYVGLTFPAATGGFFINPTGNFCTISTNGAERLRIDSSGNLGLGVTPSAFAVVKAFQAEYATLAGNSSVNLATNAYFNSGWKYNATGSALLYTADSGTHKWYNAPSGTAGNAISFTQAMTLTAAGNLLVGTTGSSDARLYVRGAGTTSATASFEASNSSGATRLYVQDDGTTRFFGSSGSETARVASDGNLLVGTTSARGVGTTIYNSSSGVGRIDINKSTSGAATAMGFYFNGTAVGSISYSDTATSFNTSSDYRLKNITGPITTSGAYIDSLNPVEGTWKADGSTFVGLIAHEVQEASRTPVATGVKDGEEMQGMDYSSAEIIANLIAEVKSLRQRLAAAGI